MRSVIGAATRGKTVAHSVVESSPGVRRLAGLAMVVHALTAMIPR